MSVRIGAAKTEGGTGTRESGGMTGQDPEKSERTGLQGVEGSIMKKGEGMRNGEALGVEATGGKETESIRGGRLRVLHLLILTGTGDTVRCDVPHHRISGREGMMRWLEISRSPVIVGSFRCLVCAMEGWLVDG